MPTQPYKTLDRTILPSGSDEIEKKQEQGIEIEEKPREEAIVQIEDDGQPNESRVISARIPDSELSRLAKLGRQSFMFGNVFCTMPSYFAPAEVGGKLANVLGLPNLKPIIEKLFGSSGVVGNVFLRNISVYRSFEAYRNGILKKDNILAFGAVNTAISDAAMATLLSDTVYEALNKWVIYVDFAGSIFGNFFVNYLSLITLQAHLCRDAETLKKYDQLDAFAFHLLGRSAEDIKNILVKCFGHTFNESINTDEHDMGVKQLLAEIERLSPEIISECINKYCETNGLWDGQSCGYSVISLIGRSCGVLAAISLFKNNFNLYLNDIHLPVNAAIPLAILPLPPKGALYDRSWATMLNHFRHLPDALRNSAFLVKQNPKYLAFLAPMIALGIYIAPSGSGFYLVGRGFIDFMWSTVFNMGAAPESGALYDASWVYKSIITLIGLMTNETAFFSAFSLIAGWVQDYLFPNENEAAKFFAKKAQTVLDETMPQDTIKERACNSSLGQVVYNTTSAVGSAMYSAASAVGSGLYHAVKYCAPSSIGEQQLLLTGNSCGFFSNSDSSRRRSLLPGIIPGLLSRASSL